MPLQRAMGRLVECARGLELCGYAGVGYESPESGVMTAYAFFWRG